MGSIVPTSNIGTGGATPAPPTPIIYLTQWKMMGNSEVHGQEIWSCGEYSAVDGKYHILVQPQGGNIVDIALDEPLRKVNDVADTIEFADGVATVTRNIVSVDMGRINYTYRDDFANPVFQAGINDRAVGRTNVLSSLYVVSTVSAPADLHNMETMGHWSVSLVYFRNDAYTDSATFKKAMSGVELIYELATPTTEVIPVPQIEEADGYTCVISQGAKAVSWSSFETNNE